MIPDIILVLLMIACGICTIVLLAAPEFKGYRKFCLIPLFVGSLLGFWLAKAVKAPYPVVRTVVCDIETIQKNSEVYQIIKDGQTIYNITLETSQVYLSTNKQAKLEFYGDTVYGVLFLNPPRHPKITIIDKVTPESK
jgi:hypothetical protein